MLQDEGRGSGRTGHIRASLWKRADKTLAHFPMGKVTRDQQQARKEKGKQGTAVWRNKAEVVMWLWLVMLGGPVNQLSRAHGYIIDTQ
jgi:hypothetical protein